MPPRPFGGRWHRPRVIGQGVEPGELLIDPRGERKRIELIALSQERRHGHGRGLRAGADTIQRRPRRIVVPAEARAVALFPLELHRRQEEIVQQPQIGIHRVHRREGGRRIVADVAHQFAIDADTKLVASWLLGSRDAGCAEEFVRDLASRLSNRVQLTSDGYRPYLEAVEGAFGADIDYAMLVKLYGQDGDNERRYSPAKCIGTVPQPVMGRPDSAHVSTSFVASQLDRADEHAPLHALVERVQPED